MRIDANNCAVVGPSGGTYVEDGIERSLATPFSCRREWCSYMPDACNGQHTIAITTETERTTIPEVW